MAESSSRRANRLCFAWGPSLLDSSQVSRIEVLDESLGVQESLAASVRHRRATSTPAYAGSDLDESFVGRSAGTHQGLEDSFAGFASSSSRKTPARMTSASFRNGCDESFAGLVAAASATRSSSTPSLRISCDDSLAEIAAVATSRNGVQTPGRSVSSSHQGGREDSSISWVASPSSARCRRSSSTGGCRQRLDDSSCSSLSTSRHVLREINSQARFEALHRDSICRLKRRETAQKENADRLDEEVRRLQNTCATPRKPWERNWVNAQTAAYTKKLQYMEERRKEEEAKKEESDLLECSFAPQLISREAPRQRRIQKAKDKLKALTAKQREWALHLESICEQESSIHRPSEEDVARAFQYGSSSPELDDSALAERKCRIGVLQVIHELALIEAEALAIASRAMQQSNSHSVRGPVTVTAAAAASSLSQLCPSFDLGLLPALRSEVEHLHVPTTIGDIGGREMPKTLFCPPQPVREDTRLDEFALDAATTTSWSWQGA